ncbi:hypothetical protein [Aggregatibacter kilianii]|uniref:hypothetical protein n=1 Tax=Aggregatibacter kilianii TaxID=2025884 RepID=UPI000D65E935|nr:hypothetical protein [Aggregatibacter kilianii]
MKIYYIYSDIYDPDLIYHIENIQEICVFRDENSIRKAVEYAVSREDFEQYKIIKQGEVCELMDHKKPFNMVFAVQALE